MSSELGIHFATHCTMGMLVNSENEKLTFKHLMTCSGHAKNSVQPSENLHFLFMLQSYASSFKFLAKHSVYFSYTKMLVIELGLFDTILLICKLLCHYPNCACHFQTVGQAMEQPAGGFRPS